MLTNRVIILVNLSQQDLSESIKFVESTMSTQLIYESAENFESLIAIAQRAKYNLLLVNGGENDDMDAAEIKILLPLISIPVILFLNNPTVEQTVDMMNAGISGVADWKDMDRVVELINRALTSQPTVPNESIYQNIVEHQTELICRYDRDLRLLFANRAYCEWQGLSANQLIGTAIVEKIPNSDREKAIAHVKALSIDNPVAISIHSSMLSDGNIQIIEWTDRAIFDENGEILEYQGVGRDVTKREGISEALRVSKAQLQGLLDSQTNYVIRTNLDGYYTYLNKKFQDEYGYIYQETDLLGAFALDSICEYHHERTYQVVEKCIIQPDTVFQVELDKPLKDGGIRTTLWDFVCLLDSSGQPSEIQCVGIDISERKQAESLLRESEEKYRTLVESSESVIVVVDATGELYFVNNITGKQLQMDVDALIGKNMYDLFPPPTVDHLLKLIHKVIHTGQGVVHEVSIPLPIGEHWYRTSLQPLRSESGTIDKVLVNAADITQFKDVETYLHQSEEKFRSIYEQSPLAIQIYDRDANLTDVNQQTLELYGIDDKKYVLGYNFWSSSDLTTEHKNALQNGQAVTVSASLDFEDIKKANLFPTNKSGILYFDIYIIPLVLKSEAMGYLAQIVDVTERNQAQANLEEANQHLELRVLERTMELEKSKDHIEAIFNHSADCILLLDASLQIQQGNHAFEQMFAIQADTYFNKSLGDLILDKDRITISSWLEDIIERHETKRLDMRAKRQDGTIFDAEISIAPINYSDRDVENFVCIIRDITERKQAEAQLQYHASLQENVSDAVIVTDMNFMIQSWNKAAERIYGWTEEEVNGISSAEVLRTEFTPEERENSIQQLQEHGWWQGEVIQHHKDDRVLYVLGSITIIKDETGNPLSIIAVNRDITDRKAHDRQMQYHASLQKSMSDAVFVTDMDFTIQSWNRAAEVIYGWTTEEAIGVHANDILQNELSENEHIQYFGQLVEQGRLTLDVVQQHKDGNSINIWCSMTLIKDELGNPTSILYVNHDITERKQAEIALRESETRYERIVNVSEEAILLTDTKARITYVNPTWIRLTGYSEEETLGREYFKFLIPENQEPARRRFQDKKAGHKFRIDTQIMRKDGSYCWVMASASPIMSPDGKFQGILSMITDIDLRKKVEIALASSLENEREMQGYLTALHDISLKLAQTETLDDFYRITVSEGLSQLGFERMGFLLYDESDGSAIGTYGTDADGKVVAEHQLRLQPNNLTGILQQAVEGSERFVVVENTQLFDNLEPIGIGDNAAAALWHDRILGWLAVDNGVDYESISQAQLDTLALYALTVGSQLASKQAEIALKASEEKYRIIANNIKDLIIRVDAHNNITYASPSSYELLGYHPEELLKINGFELIHSTDVEKVRESMNQALQYGPSGIRLEERLRHKNGSYVWVEVTAKAIYDTASPKPEGLLLSIRDISERKAAELEIQSITERLQLATSIGEIGIWEYNPDGNIMIWDEQMFNLYGVDSSQVSPSLELWQNSLHPDDLALAIEAADNAASGKKAMNMEFRIVTPEGETRYLRVRSNFKETDQGLSNQSIGVNIDITDLKEAELALRASEIRFRQLINAAPIATVVTDQNGNITLINEQAEALFGYERSELIGQAVEILIPDSVRAQHIQHRGSYMLDPHLREMGADIELFAKRKDGSLFATEIQLSYVETPDGIMVMSYVIDITERKRTEAELERQRVFLQAVIDASPSMIFVKDINARFVFVNPAMAAFFDTSVEVLMSKSDEDLTIPINEIEGFHDADQRVITRGETISLEEALTLKSGEMRWLQTTKAPLVSEDGKFIHVLGISTDITERKQAEIALQQALAKEIELNKLKSSFVSTASHQFRTPLTAILANTETLMALRDRLDETQIDTRLERIRTQVDRMKGLMDDVLELSRIQARQVQYKPEWRDLEAFCRETIEDFIHQKAYQDRIIYEGPESPLISRFDPHLMHHIFSNLLHNALKYSPDSENVYVYLANVGDEIEFRVQDQGIGISDDYLSSLFVPFSRADNVGSIAGTGLGLSIVKQSVEAHSGTISVESKLGVGTIFVVTIPYHEEGEY